MTALINFPARAYLAQAQALLPLGRLWPRQPAALFTRFLDGLVQELARLDLRATQLLDETDPRTAYELLPDWERALGLPDRCTAAATTIVARQLACWRKLAFRAGQTPAFYIALAASIGFEIEIHEFDPHVDLYDASLTPLITGGRWRYVWRVHVLNAGDISYLRMGDPVGGRLVEGDVALDIECIIAGSAPAHTRVIFSYPEDGLPVAPDAPIVADITGVHLSFNTAHAIDASGSITGGAHDTVIAGAGAKGTTSVAGDVITYTPRSGQYGADHFSYAASGPGGTSSAAMISVTIDNPPAPTVANLSGVVTRINRSIAIDLGALVTGVWTSITAGAGAHGGTDVIGRFATYTPGTDYLGADSFTFTATGPGGTSASATVSITVLPLSGGGGGGTPDLTDDGYGGGGGGGHIPYQTSE